MSENFLTSKAVRERLGDVSDMTLWRWLNDSELAFPKPTYIRRRRYWREADIDAWQATAANDNAPAPSARVA
jgi:predicted DNA-binding transcriptional regulator AlpA